MAVIVAFAKPTGLGSAHAPGVGQARVMESLALDGTTTATFADGEFAWVLNAESSAVLVATGATPNAQATAATVATTAGVGIAAGGVLPLVGKPGDKVNVKALPA